MVYDRNIDELLKEYGQDIRKFADMCVETGKRKDYVQGGGGNTSVKLSDTLMAVKASGSHLSDVNERFGYSVVDYQRAHRQIAELGEFDGRLVTVEGISNSKASIEVGLHALLGKYVLHTHSMYVNLAACNRMGREIVQKAAGELGMEIIYIPYRNPGMELMNTTRAALAEAGGWESAVLILENHGIFVSGNDAVYCIDIHERINRWFSEFFHCYPKDYPDVRVYALPDGGLVSGTSLLKKRLKKGDLTERFFTEDCIVFPYQRPYLYGNIEFVKGEPRNPQAKCLIYPAEGQIEYRATPGQAATLEETMCYVIGIYDAVTAAGYQVKALSPEDIAYIDSLQVLI